MKAYYHDEKRFMKISMELGKTHGFLQASQTQMIAVQESQTQHQVRLVKVENKVVEVGNVVKEGNDRLSREVESVKEISDGENWVRYFKRRIMVVGKVRPRLDNRSEPLAKAPVFRW